MNLREKAEITSIIELLPKETLAVKGEKNYLKSRIKIVRFLLEELLRTREKKGRK